MTNQDWGRTAADADQRQAERDAENTQATAALVDLFTDAQNNRDALAQRLAEIEATGISVAEQFKVLRADCGMLIQGDGQTFRLIGYSDGMRDAFRASSYEANAVADAWNAQLTREQMTARCWVEAIPISEALAIAIDETEALLGKIAR